MYIVFIFNVWKIEKMVSKILDCRPLREQEVCDRSNFSKYLFHVSVQSGFQINFMNEFNIIIMGSTKKNP